MRRVGLVVVAPTLVAVPVTIVPAMGLLWFLLRRYEGYFDERKLFFALVVGFFVGIVVAFLEASFDFAGREFILEAGVGTALVMFVAGYAFLEGGARTVVLGLGRFRLRKDTPYYAAGLGLGMGAMLALAFVTFCLRQAERPDAFFQPYEAVPFILMVLLFVGGILAHGGSAVYMGKAAAEGRLVKAWLLGAALQMPTLTAYWAYWPSIGHGTERNVVVVASSLFSLAYGALVFTFAERRVLAEVVPLEIRDQVRRDRRRAVRRETRGPDEPR